MSATPEKLNQQPDAESVGYGVARDRPVKSSAPPVVALDKPYIWIDKPQMVGQYLDKNSTRVKGVEVRVFDFSKSKELLDYNVLMTETLDPDRTNRMVFQSETRYSEKTDNWKVMVTIQTLEFKKIFDTQAEVKRFEKERQNGN